MYRQKILWIVLAVVIIGAGTYWLSNTQTVPQGAGTVASTTSIATSTSDTIKNSSVSDPFVSIHNDRGESTSLEANHTSLRLPETEASVATTLKKDVNRKTLSFSKPSAMKAFGQATHYLALYLTDGANVYSVSSSGYETAPTIRLVPGVDGTTLARAGDKDQNFYRDQSGVYCWANGIGGGGAITPQYRILTVPLTDSITITNLYSNNPINDSKSSTFTTAVIKNLTKGTYYKFTSDRGRVCENGSLIQISAEESAQLTS